MQERRLCPWTGSGPAQEGLESGRTEAQGGDRAESQAGPRIKVSLGVVCRAGVYPAGAGQSDGGGEKPTARQPASGIWPPTSKGPFVPAGDPSLSHSFSWADSPHSSPHFFKLLLLYYSLLIFFSFKTINRLYLLSSFRFIEKSSRKFRVPYTPYSLLTSPVTVLPEGCV